MRRFVVLLWIGLLCAVVDAAYPSATGLSAREAEPALHPAKGNRLFQPPTNTPTRTPTPINIGNFVWDDRDQDGQQDAGEPGLSGITVQLWNSTKTALLDVAVTNASGIYTVVAPVPGNYRVRVLLPGGADQFSPKDQAGGDDQDDSDINEDGVNFGFTDVFNLASNVISTTIYDAGIVIYRTPTPTRTPTPINIGNFVWHDLNANGVQDAGEPGIQYVQVQLWDSAKSQLLDTAITNASGNYTVTAPVPGDYRVRVLLPPVPGVAFTVKDAVGTETTDSDINQVGLNYGFTDEFNLASNVISTVIYDAGLTGFTTFTPTPTSTPTATATTASSITPTITNTPVITPFAVPTATQPPAGPPWRQALPMMQR